jgi:hypothetical protein
MEWKTILPLILGIKLMELELEVKVKDHYVSKSCDISYLGMSPNSGDVAFAFQVVVPELEVKGGSF